MCYLVLVMFSCILYVLNCILYHNKNNNNNSARGGGGGARKTVWTPSSNFVELNERITNLPSKKKSDVREKRYKGSKKGA